MSSTEWLYYLYCLTPSGQDVRASAIGVDGQHAVLARGCGDIGAVFSEVESGEFCGESAEAHLQDLAWLGPRVCRHEAVVEEVMSRMPVLPARFATLFTSFDSLEQCILERRDLIAGFFSELGDKQEWAVKGLLNRAEALERIGSSDEAEEPAPTTSPGTRYFQQKRTKAWSERSLNLKLKEFCRQAAAALATHAAGFRERRVSVRVTPEANTEVVLSWAYLISPEVIEDFRAHLERLGGAEGFPGLTLALTGPWPPYSFAPDLSGGPQE